MLSEQLRAWLARPPEVRTFRVSRQDIARFAIAIGSVDEIHFSAAAARGRGFADVVAPLLFYISLRTSIFNLVPQTELHAEGTPRRDIPPIEFQQAMAGETNAELYRRFVADDIVTCRRRAESAYTKEGRSGSLTFIQLEYRYTNADDEPFAVEHFTRIFR